MAGYWTRHRFLYSLILGLILAVLSVTLFVYPSILGQADSYNAQSLYKNSDIDFIAPEPSLEQVRDLPGTHGIDKLFPFLLTKTEVKVKSNSRTTTVLLTDQFQNIDCTMYSPARLIEKSSVQFDNPILVDWQFCRDTGAGIGDAVTFTISGSPVEYKIYAIYETNSIYDGGAIIAQITDAQMDTILQQSSNNGYSGIYIVADDYDSCQAYLTTEYRPLGRLKNRDQFSDDAQYQVHYDAIMSSGYANEITDFRIRESNQGSAGGTMLIWIGAILTAAILIVFNLVMSKRGCEKGYFIKHSIPKGQEVRPYYTISFLFEVIWVVVAYIIFLSLWLKRAPVYIPKSATGFKTAVIPIATAISGFVCLVMNYSMVSSVSKKAKPVATETKHSSAQEVAGSETVDADDEVDEDPPIVVNPHIDDDNGGSPVNK